MEMYSLRCLAVDGHDCISNSLDISKKTQVRDLKRPKLYISVEDGKNSVESLVTGRQLETRLYLILSSLIVEEVHITVCNNLEVLKYIIPPLRQHRGFFSMDVNIRVHTIPYDYYQLLTEITTINTDINLEVNASYPFNDHSLIVNLLESGNVRSINYGLPLVAEDHPKLVGIEPTNVKNWTMKDFFALIRNANTRYLRSISLRYVKDSAIKPFWDLYQKLDRIVSMKIYDVYLYNENGRLKAKIHKMQTILHGEDKMWDDKIKEENVERKISASLWNPRYHNSFPAKERKLVHCFLSCHIAQRASQTTFSILPLELLQIILDFTVKQLPIRWWEY